MRYPSPTRSGHYWAKWRICDEGTADEDVFTAHNNWEVVHVVENGGDPTEDDYYRVAVTGVAMSQHLDNFVWGPEVVLPKELGGEELYEGAIPNTMPDTPEIRAALQEFVSTGNTKSTRRKIVEKIVALVSIRRDYEVRTNE